VPYDDSTLNSVTRALTRSSGVSDGYIRSTAWRGGNHLGVSGRGYEINVAIAIQHRPNLTRDARIHGIRLDVSKWRRPPADSAPTASKASGLYMISTLSKRAAEDTGYDDAMMYDYRGYVAEATSSNIFLIIDGELVTPIADCFLAGITRETVFEMAARRKLKVTERRVAASDLAIATEVFLTGTAAESRGVRQIGSYVFASSSVTEQLVEDYDVLVRTPEGPMAS